MAIKPDSVWGNPDIHPSLPLEDEIWRAAGKTLDDIAAECDRLKALNAELVETLERTVCSLEEVAEDGDTIYDETMDISRAALAKARV